jgi:hypothetical protein
MNGKKPTREQKKILLKNGYDPLEWLVVKNTLTELVIIARHDKAVTVSLKKIEN